MKSLRVVIVTTGLGTGGAEHMLCKLAEATDRSRVELLVVSLRDDEGFGERIRSCGISVICCGLPHFGAASAILRAFRAIRLFAPDVLQGWMYHGSLAATLFAGLLPKQPVMVWGIRQTLYSLSNERPLTQLIIRLMALLSRRVGQIVYNSELSRTQHRQIGFADLADSTIPNGFDLDRYRPDRQRRTAFRERLGVDGDTPLVGIVARVHPMKDHQNFIDAAVLIAQVIPNARFVLVGAGTESEEMLRRLIVAGIADRVFCLGRIDATEEVYPGLDLLVLSSAWGEAWPNVLGEGMACGVPCVATDVGEAAVILGEFGRVVAPRDSIAMAEACIDSLQMTAEERGKLCDLVRVRMEKLFGIASIYCQYTALWGQLARSSTLSK